MSRPSSPRIVKPGPHAPSSTPSQPPGSMHRRVGRALQRARLALQLTQAQVAELADLSLKYLGEIERGEANTTLDRLEVIANVVGLDAAETIAAPRESIAERIRVLLRDDAIRMIERLQEQVEWLDIIAPARQLATENAVETRRSRTRRRAAARREPERATTPPRRGAW